MTIIELQKLEENGILKCHHTSYFRGYISRKGNGHVINYSGKFGNGYAWLKPNMKSTQYSLITYYIFEKEMMRNDGEKK